MNSTAGLGILLGASLFLVGSADAQSLGTSARQLSKGSLKLLAYYQGTQDQELKFSINGPGTCTAAPPSGAVTFGCDQSGDVIGEGSGGAGMIKLVFQPWESFQYYVVSGVGHYSLLVPSTTLVNSLSGDTPGFIYGAGLKAVLIPDTQFSPAVAADVSITQTRYKFNRRYPGGDPTSSHNINQALNLTQYQVALEASHVFTLVDAEDKRDQQDAGRTLVSSGIKLEPYGGVKWARIQSDLHDLQAGSHVGGQQDNINPFVGLRVPVYDREAFFAEASFVNGYQYAAGLEIRFR